MKRLQALVRSGYPLALLSGVLWAGSFPDFRVAGFAWIAPGLMVGAAFGRGAWQRFRVGYVAGLTHYLVMLYWLLLIPYRWHGIPFGPALGWLALGAFLALFPAAWVWLVADSSWARMMSRLPPPAGSVESDAGAWGLLGCADALPRRWAVRGLWALFGATAWVAWEMVLARIFGGFPWDLLGVSQQHLLPLIQVASVTGVYGVSWLVVWVSLALLSAGLMMIRRPMARSVWLGELFVPVLTVAIVFNTGLRHIRQPSSSTRHLRAALIQPSIPQTVIWNPEGDTARFRELLTLTEQALSNQVNLVVWPEAALPRMLRYDTNALEAVSGLARHHLVWMIVGSDDAEPRAGGKPEELDYFNSSFLIDPQGRLVERYIKRNLVIFGEYVPLTHWLPFLKYLTPIEGGFTAGTRPGDFFLDDLGMQASILICFEDVFPQLARRGVGPATDFLVNITNDGWFGRGAAQWQQASSAAFRCVENGLPLIRCSNNGVTCWIDHWGAFRETFFDESGSPYGKGYLIVDVPMGRPGQDHPLTFYTRHGDWFGWGCIVLSLGVVVLGCTRRRRSGG